MPAKIQSRIFSIAQQTFFSAEGGGGGDAATRLRVLIRMSGGGVGGGVLLTEVFGPSRPKQAQRMRKDAAHFDWCNG